jgi:putative heme iron utilization protein
VQERRLLKQAANLTQDPHQAISLMDQFKEIQQTKLGLSFQLKTMRMMEQEAVFA